YKLVRRYIHRRGEEVDFDINEKSVSDEQSLLRLNSVAMLDDPSLLNLQYTYNLTQIAKQLGYSNWHSSNRLIEKLHRNNGINKKGTENKYHILIKTGKMEMHKYSRHAVELLKKVDKGEEYTIEI